MLASDGATASKYGPFRGIIDGVGGSLLTNVLPVLSEDGRAILYGFTDTTTATVDIANLVFTGAGRIEGFYLFRESQLESNSKGLTRLGHLVNSGRLNCHVNVVQSWTQIGSVARDLHQRRFPGKAVLTI